MSEIFLQSHWRRSSFTILFAQNVSFILPFPCILGASSEGVLVRELRTQSRNEEAQMELGWELAVAFGFCGANPVPNLTGDWHELCRKFYPKSPRKFSALFSLSQKSTPNPRHLRGQNERQFWKLHSQWLLWVLDPGLCRCFWMSTSLCWPTKTCKLTISVAGASSNTTQRASTQWLGFSTAKIHTRFRLCLRSPKNLAANFPDNALHSARSWSTI